MNQNYELVEIKRVSIIFSSVVGMIIFGIITQLNPIVSFSRSLVIVMISSYFGLTAKWIVGEKVAKWVLQKPLKSNKSYEWYAQV